MYDDAGPFGGLNESCFGREFAEMALESCTETKAVRVDLK